jgi:hypothetical protein
MATKTGDAFLYRNAIYTYLHFQYNGFFTLSVFTLLFNSIIGNNRLVTKRKMRQFSIILSVSVLPSLFLSLLWPSYNVYLHGLAIAGCALIMLALIFFFRFAFSMNLSSIKSVSLAHTLVIFSMVSFALKILLQSGTIIPSLRDAVFGYRPIIIGFLHLVFLGLVTFYILSDFLLMGVFDLAKRFSVFAIIFFSAAIFINETVLLVNGIGLMFYSTSPIYPWLLWVAAILLLTGAILMLIAALRNYNSVWAIKKAVV